ncbi:hypothetical protein K438DRAFT_1976968 [Mycena galopus ATCC 62051]|nr:hypothetical protein K438DRAFT_1976968 [Mycena galopus ATCC 62051]
MVFSKVFAPLFPIVLSAAVSATPVVSPDANVLNKIAAYSVSFIAPPYDLRHCRRAAGADDDDMGLESISGPEEEEEVGMDDGDVSIASHGVSPSPFSHMHQHHNTNSTTHSASTSNSGARSEEVDTEEDPVTPITPLPNARFEFVVD